MLIGLLQKAYQKPFHKKVLCAVLSSVLLSFVLLSEPAAKAGSLGISAKTADGQTKKIELYSGYYALVVGCGAYRKGWSPLPNPVKDAREIAVALREMVWEVDLVEDPDGERLMDVLNRLVSGPGQDRDRGVLFWFSGHGETLDEADGTKLGYIVPVDAPDPKRDEDGFVRKAIDMRQLETIAKRIRSKHVLMAFDSCFSGAIFNMVRSSPSPFLQEKIVLPVREFLTAGREDERVPDRSVFKTCFLQAVRDKHADRNGDGYVTGEELGAYLQEEVVNYTRKAQHPQFGKINNPKLDKGDFVFMAVQTAALAQSENEQRKQESAALRQQLEEAKKDLEAEKLRQELEQTRKQLDQLKQTQSAASNPVPAMPEVKSEPPNLKPSKERVEELQGSMSVAEVAVPGPVETKKQETDVLKPSGKTAQLADGSKNPASNVIASLPPGEAQSAKKQPGPDLDVPTQPVSVEHRPRYRLAIFPFSLNRGRDFTSYNYTDTFFAAINRVIDETGLFFPVYSVYDLKNKLDTKLITNALIAKDTLDKIWSKSGTAELDMELTTRLGRQLGVDAVLVCKVRSEPYSRYGPAITTADFHIEKLETFLVDVNTKTRYSTGETNKTLQDWLATSNLSATIESVLRMVFAEYQKAHPIAPDNSEQGGINDATIQASVSPSTAGVRQKQTDTRPERIDSQSVRPTGSEPTKKHPGVTVAEMGPFLGKWTGPWEWQTVGVVGIYESRRAELTVEMKGDEPTATWMLGPYVAKNVQHQMKSQTYPARFKRIDGAVYLELTAEGGNNIQFKLDGNELQGRNLSSALRTRSSLKKQSP